jgi:hypothetical protein
MESMEIQNIYYVFENKIGLGVVAHACNPSYIREKD